jgi:hypothetical protein
MIRLLYALLLCATLAGAETAPLDDLVLPDHRGGTCRLDTLHGRLLMYFRTGERMAAKRCDQVLSRRIGSQPPLVRIIDGREYKPEDRTAITRRIAEAVGDEPITFLLDWDGEVARRLSLPDAPLLFAGIAADGRIVGSAPCTFDRGSLDRVLPLMPAIDQSAFTAEELAAVKRSAKDARP